MQLRRYENEICPIDANIFKGDAYTFFVLERILKTPCRLTITDHQNLIICHSSQPYPVWLWLPQNASVEEMEQAWIILKENFRFDDTFRLNTQAAFAKFLINRAKAESICLSIAMDMLSYSCESPIPPKKAADGTPAPASANELESITDLIAAFHEEIKIDRLDRTGYAAKAAELIKENRLYVWKNSANEITAMCSYNISAGKGGISQVYTKPDRRRRGYASNLIYAVTKIIAAQGLIPTLNTNAAYIASNACYQGIGYECKGSLCTITVDP